MIKIMILIGAWILTNFLWVMVTFVNKSKEEMDRRFWAVMLISLVASIGVFLIIGGLWL